MKELPLNIAIAQINPRVGDFLGNAAKLIEFAKDAKSAGAQCLIAPNFALSGAPLGDLAARADFQEACENAQNDLSKQLQEIGICCVFGGLQSGINKILLLENGAIKTIKNAEITMLCGVSCNVRIDYENLPKNAVPILCSEKADILIALASKPFAGIENGANEAQLWQQKNLFNAPLIYANLAGGQDDLVFAGGSFIADQKGEIVAKAPLFAEHLLRLNPAESSVLPSFSKEEIIWRALCASLKDYVDKNNFKGVLFGMSGGMDSALVLAIAVDALGKNRVRPIMLPSPYTAQMSLNDARQMAENLSVSYEEIPIKPAMDAYKTMLAETFKNTKEDVTEENLQARIRGNLLMAISNKTGYLVVTTGNKSEIGVGYCTLYGDTAGGFALLKDVYKTEVYDLARWRNKEGKVEIIPSNIITRAPSAELKPNQTDQDNLPPYEVLDAILLGLIEEAKTPQQLVEAGFNQADVCRVEKLLKASEYKRAQMPFGPLLTTRGFGRNWFYPANHFFGV